MVRSFSRGALKILDAFCEDVLNCRMPQVNKPSMNSMKTLRVVVASVALLTLGAPGFVAGVAFAHDEEDVRSQGPEFQSGYHRGYEHGYRRGYHDAISGLEYENHAGNHGSEGGGLFYAGMREGEHAGYERGFREGRERFHHHHHHDDEEVH